MPQQTSDHAVDLAHDFGGAIIFSFPLLMTMEMWWLGFYMDRFRLALDALVACAGNGAVPAPAILSHDT